MVRTIIQLDEAQLRELKALAATRSQSLAQVMREAVDALLARTRDERRWLRLRQAAGTCHDPGGDTDVAEHHDASLAAIYRS